ncbi:MAG TPA: hypothetical protein VGB53_09075 [Rubricoccaceae bacterium]
MNTIAKRVLLAVALLAAPSAYAYSALVSDACPCGESCCCPDCRCTCETCQCASGTCDDCCPGGTCPTR